MCSRTGVACCQNIIQKEFGICLHGLGSRLQNSYLVLHLQDARNSSKYNKEHRACMKRETNVFEDRSRMLPEHHSKRVWHLSSWSRKSIAKQLPSFTSAGREE